MSCMLTYVLTGVRMAKNKGGRPSGNKTRCSGEWTEARYRTFVKGALRQATMKWKPIQDCKKFARIRRGWYLCACCKEEIPSTVIVNRKRVKNAIVDHIKPIVNPRTGFTTWDDCIEQMYCELYNLQLICLECHKGKCAEEKVISDARKRKEKDELEAGFSPAFIALAVEETPIKEVGEFYGLTQTFLKRMLSQHKKDIKNG